MIQRINTIKVLHALYIKTEPLCAGEIARFWKVTAPSVYPFLVSLQKSGCVNKKKFKAPKYWFKPGGIPQHVWQLTAKGKAKYEFANFEFYNKIKEQSMEQLKCGECGIKGVRLYRPAGEFRRPERDRCNGCLTEEQRDWYIPLISDEDGSIWGYISSPEEAVKHFYSLPEANLNAPEWVKTQMSEGFEE